MFIFSTNKHTLLTEIGRPPTGEQLNDNYFDNDSYGSAIYGRHAKAGPVRGIIIYY